MLVVGNTQRKGRGVFAQKSFFKGEVLEKASVIVIPAEQVEWIDRTILTNYYYEWEENSVAIALGFSCLINHSYKPNAYYVKNFPDQKIELIAYEDIEAEEEITVNYNNGIPTDPSPLWFEVVDDF